MEDGKNSLLIIPIPLRDVTSCGTPLAAPTIKYNFLVFSRLIKPMLLLERVSLEVEGVGKDREWEVH